MFNGTYKRQLATLACNVQCCCSDYAFAFFDPFVACIEFSDCQKCVLLTIDRAGDAYRFWHLFFFCWVDGWGCPLSLVGMFMSLLFLHVVFVCCNIMEISSFFFLMMIGCQTFSAMEAISMQSWPFLPIILIALHLFDSHQRCGTRMVWWWTLFLTSVSFPACLYSLTSFIICDLKFSFPGWTRLHIYSPSTWWWSKRLWTCEWTLDSCPYGTFSSHLCSFLQYPGVVHLL